MSRKAEFTVDGVLYRAQSVSPRWYYEFNDECGHGDNRDMLKFIDGILKNCITYPAEIKTQGIDYFDKNDDLFGAEKVFKAVHSFLREPIGRKPSEPVRKTE